MGFSEAVRQEFAIWSRAASLLGSEEDDSDYTEFSFPFLIDLTHDQFSLYEAVAMRASVLREHKHLEGFIGKQKPRVGHIKGERWLDISITPEDPYRDKILFYADRDTELNFFYSTSLELFLSSSGRAYQRSTWVLPYCLNVKDLPPSEYLTKIDQDLVGPEPVIRQPFGDMSNDNLQRLHNLRTYLANVFRSE